jgi:hypothetical protein
VDGMSIQRFGRSKLQPSISYKTPLWEKKKKKVLENKWCQGQDKYSRKGLYNLSKTKYLTMNAKQNLILKGGAL